MLIVTISAWAEHSNQCHLPIGPLVIFEDLFSPGWGEDGWWPEQSGPFVSQVQTPGQGDANEKSLRIHFPSAGGTGTGLYPTNHTVYIGDKDALTFGVMVDKHAGDVFVGFHRITTDKVDIWERASVYVKPNQTMVFQAGQRYDVRIPKSVLGPSDTVIKGVVFQSTFAGYAHLDDVMFSQSGIDHRIVLKWPLSTPKPEEPSTGFGANWDPPERTKCIGLPMKHSGVDIPNAISNPVYAMEDGVVVEILLAHQTGGFADAITMEHRHPYHGVFTTVFWHVVIQPGITIGSPVSKGVQIATIANLDGTGDHLHVGIRLGSYSTLYSDKGGLPTVYCADIPSLFPEKFIDPWNTNKVLFQ